MLLKRVADKSGPEPPRNERGEDGALADPTKPEGVYLEAWPLDHVKVLSTGATKDQHFSPRFVMGAVMEGWAKLEPKQITLAVKPKKLVYRILEHPGTFCCHCGKALDGGDKIAQAHIEALHVGEESPDAQNPAGYRVDNFYRCVLED